MPIFKIVFIYWKSENDGPSYVFFLFILPGFPALFEFDIFINFGKIWALFFQLFFSYSPFGIQITYMSDIVPQVSEHLFIFLQSILLFLKLGIFSASSSGLLTPLLCLI